MTGIVVWLTGRPASGKSTLARKLAAAADEPVLVLDGDEVRASLCPSPGYDEAARDQFYETLARLAALAASQGFVVAVAATTHLRVYRDRARAHAPAFVEVFVDTPPAECIRRDPKGLYRASAEGALRSLPGAGAEYEPPLRAEVVVKPDDANAIVTIFTAVQRARTTSA